MQYKRILLKLSGESLMGERTNGIDPKKIDLYASEIMQIVNLGIEVAIVIGGGNIFRGVAAAGNGMDRVQADYMGMLATCINGMALQSALLLTHLSKEKKTKKKLMLFLQKAKLSLIKQKTITKLVIKNLKIVPIKLTSQKKNNY